jgi:cytochrome c oxidase assembly factor CtaG/ferredoxin
MSEVGRALLASWTLSPAFLAGLALLALFYVRGWRRLRLARWRLCTFAAGIGTLVIALASPIDGLASFLLTAHMVQHLLLLAAAPPLLWLGAPARALLRGLPLSLSRGALGPFLAWSALSRVRRTLARPIVGVLALSAAIWIWHLPAAYELALRAPAWHRVEHACFFGAASLFWAPVLASARRPRWALIPCLLLADLQNTALSAWLVFSDHVVYPSYAAGPRLFGFAALDDQVTAGVIMWVPGSLVFLAPVLVLCVRWLSPPGVPSARPRPAAVRARSVGPFDLLRVPLVGRFLQSRRGRRSLQAVCFVLALAVVVDGLRGPGAAPMNLAGVLPWTWWRALTVLALLAAGNFFCMACPFMLPRELGRRLGRARRAWPRRLRSKWPAVALLAGFFAAQEVFGWWNAPRATAVLVIAYFVTALVVDALVSGAGFCKYVCPIGQFQFVSSLISPLEVKVRLPTVCGGCETKDCLRGNGAQRGCELDLYLPRKVGNLDCTFCLDCARACPHDNIGLIAVVPGVEIFADRRGASIGRWSRRPDVAALALVVALSAFAAAAAMVIPTERERAVLLMLVAGAALVAAGAIRRGGALCCRLSIALIPLGSAMWAAHLLFHLVTGGRALWPIIQRALALGAPAWALGCACDVPSWLTTIELLLLDAGLLFTLYLGWRITRARARYLPFAMVAAALWLAGVWILLQPMQMRGTLS